MQTQNIYNQVRLSKSQIDAIIGAFQNNFNVGDHLWVFGSRADLMAKGGDIDLYIETNIPIAKDAIDKKFKMVSNIWRQIGEQKIDVVINMLNTNQDLEIYQHAREYGIQLV